MIDTHEVFKVPEGQRYSRAKRVYWYLKLEGKNYIAVWRYYEGSNLDRYRKKMKNYYYSESEAERALMIKLMKKARPLDPEYSTVLNSNFWKFLV